MFLIILVVVIRKNKTVNRKNQSLVAQITEALKYKDLYYKVQLKEHSTSEVTPDINTLTDEQCFRYIEEIILSEQLFRDPYFGRQTLMNRFHLSKERVGAIFSKNGEHAKMSSYDKQAFHGGSIRINVGC